MQGKTIVIAAGGTGGHLYPGIALARELISKGFNPVFFVRQNDIGRSILEKEALTYREIPAMGFPRGVSLKLLKFPFMITAGFISALSKIRAIKPLVVAGMGGYVSFPTALCAKILGIPVIIHEQNALPGLSNRAISRFADKVAVSFEQSERCFSKRKTVLTGNPVRKDLFNAPGADVYKKFGLSEGKFTVLVFGGSQGARKINSAVTECFGLLKGIKDKIQFLHIAGPVDYERLSKEYAAKSIPGRVLDYVHAIGEAYAVSDSIVCRSGATTVAELRILNKRALLVPFPYAAENHQEVNARALESEGLARVVLEKDLNPEILAEAISGAFRLGQAKSFPKIPDVFPQDILASEVIKLARVPLTTTF